MHEGKQIGIVERGPRARVVEGTSYDRVYDLITMYSSPLIYNACFGTSRAVARPTAEGE